MAETNGTTQNENPITIGEGVDVYGSDGEKWGRVIAVGAKYVTLVEGLFGQKEYHIPVGLISAGNDERVDLSVPVEQAKEQSLDEEPPDEPIYAHSEKIPEHAMETANVPEPEHADVGTGEDAEETERTRQAKRME